MRNIVPLKHSLDIVLPCYNPVTDWTFHVVKSIQTIRKLIPDFVEIFIYIVNDGSTKGITQTEIDYLYTQLNTLTFISYLENKGKGYALRKGISQSTSDFVIFTDIDFPYEEQSIIEVYIQLVSGKKDIIIGVREEAYYKNVPKIRIFISKLLKSAIKLFLKLPVEDTQCGLKGFNRKAKPIFLSTKIERYLFDIEFIYLASKNRSLHIGTQTVTLKPGIRFSKMNIKILLREFYNFISIFSDHRVNSKITNEQKKYTS